MVKKTYNLEELLKQILIQAKTLLRADGASIFLREGNNLLLKATTGVNVERESHSYSLGEGISGKVLKAREPLLIKNVMKNHLYDEIEHPKSRFISLIAMPILYDKEIVGVLRCTRTAATKKTKSDQAFSDIDTEVLKVFAQTAATAIEATQELELATNAPYAFVLMPFDKEFRDVYELGIRDVVDTLGIRCERVDEIEFNESILAQIYKGIQSADIIIADMTGRNPNVFYEVGYAHALHKEVILLTQKATDIPFDLKGHNHIIYKGQITVLKERLKKRLGTWLIKFRTVK